MRPLGHLDAGAGPHDGAHDLVAGPQLVAAIQRLVVRAAQGVVYGLTPILSDSKMRARTRRTRATSWATSIAADTATAIHTVQFQSTRGIKGGTGSPAALLSGK
jgi:hypothetical protein